MTSLPTGGSPVEVRRSARRRRTVTAYRNGGTIVVLIPARFTRAEEREWVKRMVDRLDSRERRVRRGDADLAARAEYLAKTYLDDPGGEPVRPASVRWVGNQQTRWGSCTPSDRTIRLSKRLQGMPSWVVDYVLLHELTHLRVPGHGPDFWSLVERYPRTEKARGFLDGVSFVSGNPEWQDEESDVDAGMGPAEPGTA
jgi:predicted metal-dependent hydrolase